MYSFCRFLFSSFTLSLPWSVYRRFLSLSGGIWHKLHGEYMSAGRAKFARRWLRGKFSRGWHCSRERASGRSGVRQDSSRLPPVDAAWPPRRWFMASAVQSVVKDPAVDPTLRPRWPTCGYQAEGAKKTGWHDTCRAAAVSRLAHSANCTRNSLQPPTRSCFRQCLSVCLFVCLFVNRITRRVFK